MTSYGAVAKVILTTPLTTKATDMKKTDNVAAVAAGPAFENEAAISVTSFGVMGPLCGSMSAGLRPVGAGAGRAAR